jgi:hypothetical protein
VLRFEPRGPSGAIGGDVAYLPAEGWRPGQPASLRRRVVLVAVLVALCFLATLLVRSKKRSIVLMAVGVVAFTVAIEMWRRSRPSTRAAYGHIIVQNPTAALAQRDSWKYVAAPQGGRSFEPVDGVTVPVLIDAQYAERVRLNLHCRNGGVMEWRYDLARNTRIAFRSRRIEPRSALPSLASTSRSPMIELARREYLRSGGVILGETGADHDDDTDTWPAVVVGNATPASP